MAKKSLSVTLHFKTKPAKDYFLGQLSDGWGENVVDLDWPSGRSLKHAPDVIVTVFKPDSDEGEILTEEDANPARARRRANPSGCVGQR